MMMIRMLTESFVAASLLTMQCLPFPAYAENQMGYRLLSPQEASALPHNHGALGLPVERAQQITDGGMTFDIIRVTQVRQASTGAQAGFNVGDEIVLALLVLYLPTNPAAMAKRSKWVKE